MLPHRYAARSRFIGTAARGQRRAAPSLPEEIAMHYELVPVDARNGRTVFGRLKAITPDAKTPAPIDRDAIAVDSKAILRYLVERTGRCNGRCPGKLTAEEERDSHARYWPNARSGETNARIAVTGCVWSSTLIEKGDGPVPEDSGQGQFQG